MCAAGAWFGLVSPGEDGVEETFGGYLAEHSHHEHEGGKDQRCCGVHEGAGVSGCGGGVPDLVVKEEEVSEVF